MSWETILVAALSGGITGTIAPLWIPYINWGIKKRKMKFEARQSAIQSIYNLNDQDDNRIEFSKSSSYSKIRPYLSASLVEGIEKGEKTIVIVAGGGRGSGVNPFWSKLLDEVAILEKKWRLI